MDVDRGPDWMFVRLHPAEELGPGDLSLAEKIWSILQQSFVYRLVLELDELEMLHSSVIAQLVLLAKRIHSHNGMLRLCGLSDANQEVIHICRLGRMLAELLQPGRCGDGASAGTAAVSGAFEWRTSLAGLPEAVSLRLCEMRVDRCRLGAGDFELVLDEVDAFESQKCFLRHLLLIPGTDLAAERDAAFTGFDPQVA